MKMEDGPAAVQMVHVRRPGLLVLRQGRALSLAELPRAGQIIDRLSTQFGIRALVIDPVLSYSTYLGGAGDDAVAVSNAASKLADIRSNLTIKGDACLTEASSHFTNITIKGAKQVSAEGTVSWTILCNANYSA